MVVWLDPRFREKGAALMRWLCVFFPCKWLHIWNVQDDPGHLVGLYQCPRCKTLSVGRMD